MKVLITGGCGFLGSNLASAFLADGSEVVVIDALFRKGSASNLHWLEGQAATINFIFCRQMLPRLRRCMLFSSAMVRLITSAM